MRFLVLVTTDLEQYTFRKALIEFSKYSLLYKNYYFENLGKDLDYVFCSFTLFYLRIVFPFVNLVALLSFVTDI